MGMQRDDYLKKYAGLEIPRSLEALAEFHVAQGDALYAEGFYLVPDDRKVMFETYSSEPEFTRAFMTIGTADGKGSEYAFWLGGGTSPKAAPIVVFGGEGGCHVVASEFEELLAILSFDVEPSVDWGGVFYDRLDPHRPSPRAPAFHDWLQRQCGVSALGEAASVQAIVERAQARHEGAFAAFKGRFFQE